jgi:hypothetical protein
VLDTDQSGPSQPPPQQHFAISSYRTDNARTGVNALETTLTPANVNPVNFGRRAAIAVVGDVYAQPLYISNVTTADGTTRNLVIVATQHDQVYAIDTSTQAVAWQRSFLDSGGLITPVPADDVSCGDIANEIGITGTPVLDPATERLYLVVRTKETSNGQAYYYQRIHALSVVNGRDALPATNITTPLNRGNKFGSARFDPLHNHQRAALLLANGQVYVSWASHCDAGNYWGWVMAFDEQTLQLTSAWIPSPVGAGGIWMSASGPAADENGEVYLAVGNGWSDAMTGGSNYGDSVVRLHSQNQNLSVVDYFMPFDYQKLFDEDLDLGSGGPVLLPTQTGAAHPHLLVTSSKDSMVYLLDRDNLGKWHADEDSQILQSFLGSGYGSYATPAVWNNTVYFGFTASSLQAFAYDPVQQQINTTPSSTSGSIILGFPGASPVISASGSDGAILWVLQTDQFNSGGPAILRAFDPANLANEYYDSAMSPDRDSAGAALRFTVPVVADGQVFVAGHNEIDIYGLL